MGLIGWLTVFKQGNDNVLRPRGVLVVLVLPDLLALDGHLWVYKSVGNSPGISIIRVINGRIVAVAVFCLIDKGVGAIG